MQSCFRLRKLNVDFDWRSRKFESKIKVFNTCIANDQQMVLILLSSNNSISCISLRLTFHQEQTMQCQRMEHKLYPYLKIAIRSYVRLKVTHIPSNDLFKMLWTWKKTISSALWLKSNYVSQLIISHHF